MNPVDAGLFTCWISDQIYPNTPRPKSGNTGVMLWMSDNLWIQVYQAAAAPVPPAAVSATSAMIRHSGRALPV